MCFGFTGLVVNLAAQSLAMKAGLRQKRLLHGRALGVTQQDSIGSARRHGERSWKIPEIVYTKAESKPSGILSFGSQALHNRVVSTTTSDYHRGRRP